MQSIMLGFLVCSAIARAVDDDPRAATSSDAPPIERSSAAEIEYRVGPGDTVRIVVHGNHQGFDHEEFTVSAQGDISFPYIGKVHAASTTPFELEALIRKKLADGYIQDPVVTASIVDYRSQTVDVVGAVNEPGVYPLDGHTSVRSLLAKAGSVQSSDSTGYVLVMRGDKKHRFALADLEGGEGDFPLQDGDVVEVERGANVFLAGQVQKPGPISFVEGITASQALLMAGGSNDYGRLAGAYIVRDGSRISVNLKRVLKGKESDLALQPGDRIVVPQSPL